MRFTLVKRVEGRRVETTYDCDHMSVSIVPQSRVLRDWHGKGRDLTFTAGIDIEVCFDAAAKDRKMFNLPTDGESIYVVDPVTGKTTKAYHWPPKPVRRKVMTSVVDGAHGTPLPTTHNS